MIPERGPTMERRMKINFKKTANMWVIKKNSFFKNQKMLIIGWKFRMYGNVSNICVW